MQTLYLFQEVPNTELSWCLYGLVGVFIMVIIIGSLTNRGKNIPTPEARHETRKTPPKKNRSNSMKSRKE